MEFQKIVNFIGITSDNKDLPTFVTKKWIEVYDQSQGNYDVKGNITVTKKTFTPDDIDAPNNTATNVTAINAANDNAFGDKKLVFKINVPFINCISKINGVDTDNAEDLDV